MKQQHGDDCNRAHALQVTAVRNQARAHVGRFPDEDSISGQIDKAAIFCQG
jgi:hypothetical protein